MVYIFSIHKNGIKQDCNNYRGISVSSTLSRLIRNLVEEEYKNTEEEVQSEFWAGRSSNNNVFGLKQIVQKKTATNRELHLIFIDLQKAYDQIQHNHPKIGGLGSEEELSGTQTAPNSRTLQVPESTSNPPE
ncbi:hypothetical protein JTB14_014281 [Gonioctena quinquepunctata]|nr:hypothetical protein JTB14_014281 [Gonioctena quinquepunctata]